MAAFGCKVRFVPPYIAGRKGGTIRAHRKDGRDHAQLGGEIHLYTGLRTPRAYLFGRETCVDYLPIRLAFKRRPLVAWPKRTIIARADLDRFAVFDGFENFDDMEAFWQATHRVEEFNGGWILWKDKPL